MGGERRRKKREKEKRRKGKRKEKKNKRRHVHNWVRTLARPLSRCPLPAMPFHLQVFYAYMCGVCALHIGSRDEAMSFFARVRDHPVRQLHGQQLTVDRFVTRKVQIIAHLCVCVSVCLSVCVSVCLCMSRRGRKQMTAHRC